MSIFAHQYWKAGPEQTRRDWADPPSLSAVVCLPSSLDSEEFGFGRMPRSRAEQRVRRKSRIKADVTSDTRLGHIAPQCGAFQGFPEIFQVAVSGGISEGKITLWRQFSPEPYCPNGLRRGLL